MRRQALSMFRSRPEKWRYSSDLLEAELPTAETSKYTQMFGFLVIKPAGPRGCLSNDNLVLCF